MRRSTTRRNKMKTTVRHFVIFKAECERLARLWGPFDSELRIRHQRTDGLASCAPSAVDRICTIRLHTDWGENDKPTDERMLGAARHEMAHMVTQELIVMARARYVTDDEMTSAIETTARRLERLLPK